MKALLLRDVGRIELVDIAMPDIAENELLVKTGATTICTSDLNDIRENPFDIDLPVVLGHEASGTVVSIGSKVKGFQAGDRIAAHPVHPCGRCKNCQRGWGHLCLSMEHFGLNRPGTFAEYFPVRSDRARHIPDDVPFTVAALAEPVSVCLEALAQARLSEGGTLLIVGDGPFGILMTYLVEPIGLRKCVLTGEHDFRLGKARHALPVNIHKTDDLHKQLMTETGGEGFDAVILAVSSAAALRQSLLLLKAKGRMVVFSAIPGETAIDLFDVHLRELELVGACSDQDRFDEAILYLSNTTLPLETLITHTFPLAAYQAAITQAAHHHEETLKVAFVFDKED